MRSVVVVFPASMCAMMPMFLQRSNGTVLATVFLYSFWGSKKFGVETPLAASPLAAKTRQASSLPSVMRERLVRFRHAVHIFFLLDGGALAVGGVEQFVRQLVDHSFFATTARIGHDPADRERCAAVGTNFNRHLVVRTTDTPGLHFQQRLGIFNCFLEQLQGLVAALFLELRKRLVE